MLLYGDEAATIAPHPSQARRFFASLGFFGSNLLAPAEKNFKRSDTIRRPALPLRDDQSIQTALWTRHSRQRQKFTSDAVQRNHSEENPYDQPSRFLQRL